MPASLLSSTAHRIVVVRNNDPVYHHKPIVMAELFLWSLTTGIAIFALYSSEWTPVHQRLLPWTGGILVGVSLFWVVPDVAEGEGWPIAVAAILAGIAVLVLVDRYVYPVCPFCASGTHPASAHKLLGLKPAARLRAGWPLLAAGCVHCFFDGWLIALPQAEPHAAISTALSLGFAAHKIPEAFAIGLLASTLTSTRTRGLAVVLLIQTSFALGIVAVLFAKGMDYRLVNGCVAAAGATLLFFGLTVLRNEWQIRGAVSALKAGTLGIAGCALVALTFHFL